MRDPRPTNLNSGLEIRKAKIKSVKQRAEEAHSRATALFVAVHGRLGEELRKDADHQDYDTLHRLELERGELERVLFELEGIALKADGQAAKILERWLTLEDQISRSER